MANEYFSSFGNDTPFQSTFFELEASPPVFASTEDIFLEVVQEPLEAKVGGISSLYLLSLRSRIKLL